MEDPKQPQNSIIKQLLRETLTLLCKNTVVYNSELCIEGLLGLTVDKNEIILVSIKEMISKDTNIADDQHGMTEPSQVNDGSRAPVSVKKKAKKSNKAMNNHNAITHSENCVVSETICEEGRSVVPAGSRGQGEAMRIQVDFDYERIEVKEEENVVNSCATYECNDNVSVQDGGRMHHEVSSVPEYSNCYVENGSGDLCNSETQNNFHAVQNNLDVLEQNVDSFMSMDQKIFQEMFQTDFAAGSLSYDVEGTSSEQFRESGGSQSNRHVQRRRTAFAKTDGSRGPGIHRRGYRFHCRYGYSRILHQCSQCSATFTMSSNLGRHMATMHNLNGDGLSICCPICEKRFSRSDNLARHLKQVHKHPASQVPFMALPPPDS